MRIFWIWSWKCTLSSFNYETLCDWSEIMRRWSLDLTKNVAIFQDNFECTKISTFRQSYNVIVIYDPRLFFPSSKNSIVFEVTNVPTATLGNDIIYRMTWYFVSCQTSPENRWYGNNPIIAPLQDGQIKQICKRKRRLKHSCCPAYRLLFVKWYN